MTHVSARSASSALIVPVPALEAAVGHPRSRLDPAAAVGVPAHSTLLFPFVETPDGATSRRLRDALAGHAPFDSTWSATGWFGDDVLFVEPDDPRPFVALTRSLERAFPEHPAYGGAFDEVHPHVTIGHAAPLDVLQRAEAEVVPHLPAVQRVEAVELWSGPVVDAAPAGRWALVERYALG